MPAVTKASNLANSGSISTIIRRCSREAWT